MSYKEDVKKHKEENEALKHRAEDRVKKAQETKDGQREELLEKFPALADSAVVDNTAKRPNRPLNAQDQINKDNQLIQEQKDIEVHASGLDNISGVFPNEHKDHLGNVVYDQNFVDADRVEHQDRVEHPYFDRLDHTKHLDDVPSGPTITHPKTDLD